MLIADDNDNLSSNWGYLIEFASNRYKKNSFHHSLECMDPSFRSVTFIRKVIPEFCFKRLYFFPKVSVEMILVIKYIFDSYF